MPVCNTAYKLPSTPSFIAVYGSLRVGEVNNGFMNGLEHVGTDKIDGTLFNLGWYPGVKLDGNDNQNFVVVDVYRLPEENSPERRQTITTLDRYEGFDPNNTRNSLFQRKVVTPYELGEKAYVYEYNHKVSSEQEVKDGDWSNRNHD